MSAAAPRTADAAKHAAVFSALGDETRLALLVRLSGGGPQSIVSLTAGTSMSRQAMTKHLHVLADAGLVRSTRSGRETLFAFDARKLDAARSYLDAVSRHWDDALARLKAQVER